MYGVYQITLRSGEVIEARATSVDKAIRWINATKKLDLTPSDVKSCRFKAINLPVPEPKNDKWIADVEKKVYGKLNQEERERKWIAQDKADKKRERALLYNCATAMLLFVFVLQLIEDILK